MNRTLSRVGSFMAVSSIAALAAICTATPAMAATGSGDQPVNAFGQCLVAPSQSTVVNHGELSHLGTTTTPGTDAVTHEETRWKQDIPAIEELSHQETQYFQVIPGHAAVTHDQWKYFEFVPGQKEESHLEYQFSRENPGVEEKTHLEYQFSRTNQGQKLIQHDEYKYQKVTKNSHTESRYQKTIKVYTVEHKKIQVPSGQNRNAVLNWLSRIGATNLGGDWWQLPDAVVAKAGINPFNVAQSGSVNLSYYGGPSATVSYQITGIDTYDTPPSGDAFVNIGVKTVYYTGGSSFSLNASDAIWVNTTTPPAGYSTYGQPRTVQDPDTVTLYNGGNWTRDPLPAGYTQTDHRVVIDQAYVAPYTEYRKADGTGSPNVADAGWFRDSSFDGWNQYGQAKTVEDQKYVAPFEEYRTANGTASPNVADAAWFTESSFDDWNQYGDPKKVVTQQYRPDETFYLHRDDQGNLSSSTDEADASIFTSDEGVDLSVWTQYDKETITDEEAVPDKTVYLTEDANGVLGQTDTLSQASWIKVDEEVPPVWQQMVNLHGDPVIRTIIDREGVEAYTQYYVPNGEPTRTLGDTNWTKDEDKPNPEQWTFVDQRTVTDKAAVPPIITSVKIIDKAAWNETVVTPAKYDDCAVPASEDVLAHTGSDTSAAGPLAGLALLGAAVGGGLVVASKRRARHAKSEN